MYRMAFDALKATWPVVLVAAVALAGLKIFLDDGTAGMGGALVAYAMVALYAHRAMLLGETLTWRDSFRSQKSKAVAIPMGSFIWRMFGWWLFAGAAWLCCFLALRWLFLWMFDEMAGEQLAGLVVIALIPTTVIALPALAAFGTVLPAVAIGGDSSLGRAWQRGRQTFWSTLGQLWGGNILFFVGANAVLLWLFPTTGVVIIDGAFQVLFELAGLFAILLTASALSLAYQRSDPVADAGD